MNLRRIVPFLLTAVMSVSLLAQQKQRVAVLEPYGKPPVTEMNKNAVRGAMEEGLVSTGRYSFLDRSRIDSILSEQKFQRSALSDPDSSKRLGKLLNADMICISDLLKDGQDFNIRVSIIDVESGEIAHSASEQLVTDSNVAINEAVRKLTARMMAQGKGGVPVPTNLAAAASPATPTFPVASVPMTGGAAQAPEAVPTPQTRRVVVVMPYVPGHLYSLDKEFAAGMAAAKRYVLSLGRGWELVDEILGDGQYRASWNNYKDGYLNLGRDELNDTTKVQGVAKKVRADYAVMTTVSTNEPSFIESKLLEVKSGRVVGSKREYVDGLMDIIHNSDNMDERVFKEGMLTVLKKLLASI